MIEAKIYKLTCIKTNLVYYGYTTRSLNERLKEHINKNNNSTSKKLEEPKIELIELIICKDIEELKNRENFYIENNECVNKCINRPDKNYEKYRKDRKEYMKKYFQNYNNKWKSLKNKCECGGSYTNSHKARHEKTKKHINFINSN